MNWHQALQYFDAVGFSVTAVGCLYTILKGYGKAALWFAFACIVFAFSWAV